MRSSTLLALTPFFFPLAVLSSPRPPPPIVEFEIIPFRPPIPHTTTTTSANPGGPIANPGATSITTASNATITSGSEKEKTNPEDDECENENLPAGVNPPAGVAGTGAAVYPTTFTTSVADKLRRQNTPPPLSTPVPEKLRHRQNDDDDNTSSTTTTSTTTTTAADGINPPAGVAGGTAVYQAGPTAGGSSDKKLKANGSGCAKGFVKLVNEGSKKNATMMTTTSTAGI